MTWQQVSPSHPTMTRAFSSTHSTPGAAQAPSVFPHGNLPHTGIQCHTLTSCLASGSRGVPASPQSPQHLHAWQLPDSRGDVGHRGPAKARYPNSGVLPSKGSWGPRSEAPFRHLEDETGQQEPAALGFSQVLPRGQQQTHEDSWSPALRGHARG